jgi:hypothetical protein
MTKDTTKDGLERTTMQSKPATEQAQDPQRQQSGLDSRYGKIGISAVAAALCHRGERRSVRKAQAVPYDLD